MLIIGIHGNADSGKDTVAEYICGEYFNFEKHAFAESLKLHAAQIFSIPLNHFYERQYKEKKVKGWDKSPREIAQLFGTESMRNVFGEDFWIKVLEKKLEKRRKRTNVVISDVRFENEVDWIVQNKGIIFHLQRPGSQGNVGVHKHESEKALDLSYLPKESLWHIANDDTLSTLYNNVDSIMKQLKHLV